MLPLETVFVWAAIFIYSITFAFYTYALVFVNDWVYNRVHYGLIAGFVLHTLAFGIRYMELGNLPWAYGYEVAATGSWFITAFTLYLIIRHRQFKAVGVVTLPMSILFLGYAVVIAESALPMSAATNSIWLIVHVFFAWLAFGAYVICFALGVVYLLKGRFPQARGLQKFPELKSLDEYMFRYLVFGFITDAVMIASGAIWAKDLWGNYWSWDPVEMWSLVTWLIYGFSIHVRVTFGWKGKRMAWLMIVALTGMIITYFGLNYMVEQSLHFFEVWQEL